MTLKKKHIPFDTVTGAGLASLFAISLTNIWAVGNHLIAHYTCQP